MDDALFVHRVHFAFTVTYHYLFPQLTKGISPRARHPRQPAVTVLRRRCMIPCLIDIPSSTLWCFTT